jgi:hypothetical protein
MCVRAARPCCGCVRHDNERYRAVHRKTPESATEKPTSSVTTRQRTPRRWFAVSRRGEHFLCVDFFALLTTCEYNQPASVRFFATDRQRAATRPRAPRCRCAQLVGDRRMRVQPLLPLLQLQLLLLLPLHCCCTCLLLLLKILLLLVLLLLVLVLVTKAAAAEE